MNYFANASSFLVEALVGLALYAVLLRFWMQWVRADFRNQIGHFLITTTNPVVVPLRKVLPSIGLIDTATVVLALVIAVVKTVLLATILGGMPSILNLLLFSVVEILRCSLYLFFAAIIVSIIASWINPYSTHPLVTVARSIAEPLMAPFRRLIPPIAGLDISPIFVFLVLNLALLFLSQNCPIWYRCFP
jgi:YggT family protein